MKNIFKLGSVFMAIALLVSTILLTGVLVSADQVVATWSGHTNYIWAPSSTAQVYGWQTDQPNESWLSFAGDLGDLDADSYLKITATADFAETPATAGFKSRTWSINTAIDADSISATTLEYTIEGPLTYNSGDPNLEFVLPTAALNGLTDTDINVTVTVYKKGGSSETTATGAATEAEPTATAAPTEPAATADWQLVWSGMIDQDFNSGEHAVGALSYGELNAAIANEVATYGASEKYKLDSTDCSYVSGGAGYAYWIFMQDDPYIENYPGADVGTVATVTLSPDEQAALTGSFYFAYCGDDADTTIHAGEVSLYAYRLPATEPTATEAEPTATEAEPTATEAEPTATEAEPTVTEAEPTATEAEPTATEAEPTATEAEPTATEAEPTATEAEPTATEAEPTATEAEPTATEAEPTATQAEPVTLVETVLMENNVGGVKTLKPEKTDAWFLVVNEIKSDIAKNGPIDPDKGEYYEITVTGSVDNGEADFHLGEGLDWNEYWGKSGSVGTEESTVTAQIPVAIPAEGIGDVYLADSGEAGHTLSWTYAKVSVFRVGEPTEPVITETEPTATETGIDGILLGDANGDGTINLKDVLAARKYVAGIETEIDLVASDVNFDDAVNMKDILLIRKYIAEMITSFVE